MYAPTAKAPPGIKAKFVADLQALWMPFLLVMSWLLGDFNACGGKHESEDKVWREVGGLHGLGTCMH